MQVKAIHFIKQCPGKPIYQMTDGTLRLPFSQNAKNGFDTYWLSEAEIVEAAFTSGRLDKNNPDSKYLAQIRLPFTEAKKELGLMPSAMSEN